MSDLPDGWEWATVSDVARIASNLVNPADHHDAPHIAPNHIESWTGRLLPFATVAADHVTSSKHKFLAGQLLYSKIRPYLAKVALVDFAGLCSADMYPIDSYIDRRYLKWWMLTSAFTEAASKHQGRSVLPKINSKALATLPVPVAPLAEQRRIVTVLEDHLSHLDAGMTYLTSAEKRASQLSNAWLANLVAPLKPEPLPLGKLIAEKPINGRSVPTEDGGFPVLRLTAIKNGRVDLKERKGGAWSPQQASPFLVKHGDFLVSRGNGSISLVGRGGLVRDIPDPVAFPDTLIRIRVNEQRLSPTYLSIIWNSPLVREQIERQARTTAGIYKINQSLLQTITIPTPTIADQLEIVRQFEEVNRRTHRVQSSITLGKRRKKQLCSSLLTDAFTGRLMSQDPADEPAYVLLQRIRTERAKQPNSKRSRTTKNITQETLL